MRIDTKNAWSDFKKLRYCKNEIQILGLNTKTMFSFRFNNLYGFNDFSELVMKWLAGMASDSVAVELSPDPSAGMKKK